MLRQAAQTMSAVSGYRFAASVTSGGTTTTVVGEFQAPDRLHETVTVPGAAPVEAVFIGTSGYLRDRSGRWGRPQHAGAGQSDPRAAFSAISQATDVRLAGGWYDFTLPSLAAGRLLESTAGATGTGRARVDQGRITRLELHLSGSGHTVDIGIDYSGIGSAPPVTAPPA